MSALTAIPKINIDSVILANVIRKMHKEMLEDPIAADTTVVGDVNGMKFSLVCSTAGALHPACYINDNIAIKEH